MQRPRDFARFGLHCCLSTVLLALCGCAGKQETICVNVMGTGYVAGTATLLVARPATGTSVESATVMAGWSQGCQPSFFRPVTLIARNLPPGVLAEVRPTPLMKETSDWGYGTVTLAVPAAVPAGTYNFTLEDSTAGWPVRASTLRVVDGSDFEVLPSLVTLHPLQPGGLAQRMVFQVNAVGSSPPDPVVEIGDLPAGIAASVEPSPDPELRLVAFQAQSGSAVSPPAIRVSFRAGTLVRDAWVSLIVSASLVDFRAVVVPRILTVAEGSGLAQAVLRVERPPENTQPVTWYQGHGPVGVQCAFTAQSSSSDQVDLVVRVPAWMPKGLYPLHLEVRVGPSSRWVQAFLRVP